VLTHLQIRDFAIIDHLELELGPGMTALTGETGAGKSICVDALLLVTGARAGAEVIRQGSARAEITASFTVSGNAPALEWLREQEIEHEGECTLRRVLTVDGRSRAWINGQSMPVQSLRQLGETLLDVHGQMEYQSLVRRAAQRELLDRHGKHEQLLAEVTDAWRALSALRTQRDQAHASSQDRAARLELLEYHVRELETLDLKADEVAELAAERLRLSQSGRLASGLREIITLLREAEDINAERTLSRALNTARTLASIDPRLNQLSTLMEEAFIAAHEAAEEASRRESALDADPARQEWVESRLAAIEGLARKHRVEPSALAGLLVELRHELESLRALEISAGELDAQIEAAERTYGNACARLTRARRASAKALSERVTALMQQLGMSGGKFVIDINALALADAGPHGADEVEFLVTTNAGLAPKPLAKVASGGELSRISLAIQVAALETDVQPVLVFDEVDAGVGGAVAEIVGQQLRTLGERAQVLCVTHLPQVASQAHAQIRAVKLSDGKTTRTVLHPLSPEERVEEIARMLGGREITEKARAHAAEMLAAPQATTRKRRGRQIRG
jgi:DNA repair protein RecN (Recombination protein N)